MKKNLFLAAILSTMTMAAHAEDQFQYAGFSAGINSHTTSASKSNSDANGVLTFGEGLRLTDAQALAGELQLVSLNGHMIPAAQMVYFTSGSDMSLDHVPVTLALHSGVGARMGLTTGVDLMFPLTMTIIPTASIRTGFTLFQNKVDGARGLFNVGLYNSF